MADMQFEMPKSFTDVKPPVILETRVYRFMVDNPRVEPNKNQDGTNLVIDFRVIDEGEALNGVSFRKWFALPSPKDEGRLTARNQPMVDFKMAQVEKVINLLGGTIKGRSFTVPQYATCKMLVKKEFDQKRQDFYNIADDEILPDDKVASGKPGLKKS